MWTKKDIPDQGGKIVIVTGANAGVGYETALALYKVGAHVILACRNLEKANQAISKIKEHPGKGTLEAGVLDLASLAAVKQFADDFKTKHQKLDVLINNAGVMIPPASKTADGYELQFGVNFIGHFALTGHLYPVLENTQGSRVVTVSSNAYLPGVINFDNLKSEQDYEPMREYRQSKLGNMLFSVELQRRIEATGDNVLSIAVQPGANKSDLSRHMDPVAYDAAVERLGGIMDPWQGALPSLYAATMPEVKGGDFYEPDQQGGYKGFPWKGTIAVHAMDEAVAKKLWRFAEDATVLHYPTA
jgi:NAD(P)-dependent dehydrogenase (short-subunit alcohol dehydrogenase family)